MALRFIDSFDHYVTADLGKKWTAAGGGTISAGNGRNSTSSLRLNSSGTITKQIDAQATWIFGFAFRTTNTASMVILNTRSSSTAQVRVQTTAGGVLIVDRNTTLLATGTTALANNTWYYLEFYFTISDTVGVVKARINGAAESFTFVTGTETTQDTRNGTSTTVDNFLLQSGSGSTDIDDLYVCDGTDGTASQGAANNDFLGDCRVEALLPSGAGNHAQWSRSTGADNYANVDDATADGDTTYNYELTSGDIDSFAMGDLTMTSGTVYAVQTNIWARKDDAGTRSVKPHFRISATDYARTTVNLSDSYLDFTAIEGKSPAGSAWDAAAVNGLEFGYKVP